MLGDHGGHAAAAGGAVQEAYGRYPHLDGQAIEVHALGPDGAVGVAPAGGEVVGAHHHGPGGDGAPAPDVVGGGERRHPAFVVVRREPGDAADLAEGSLVEEQGDALPAGQLAPAALPYHAGFIGSRRQPVGASCCRSRMSRSTSSQGSAAVRRPGGRGPVLVRVDHRQDVAGGQLRARLERLERGDHPGAGRQDDRLHLHGADHEEGVTLDHTVAFADPELDQGAGHGALHAVVAVDQEREVGREAVAVAGRAGAPRGRPARRCGRRRRVGRRPLLQKRHGLAGRPGWRQRLHHLRGVGQPGRPRVPVADFRCRENRPQQPDVGGQAGQMEFVQGPAGPVDGGAERMRRRGTSR